MNLAASKVMVERVLANEKINIMYDTVPTHLNGVDHLESIACSNVKTGEVTTIMVDGLFYGLGLKPNTKLFDGILTLDSDGYIIKAGDHHYETMTSIPGIFVAGDASDKVYRQAVVASGDGCKSALDVNNYLVNEKFD